MPAKQRKMVEIDVTETSGVDHPAHLFEGWIVKKSVEAGAVEKLFGIPNKEDQVADEVEKVRKEDLDEVQSKLDAALAENKRLKSELKVKKDADEAETIEGVEKSTLPENVRQAMEKQAEDLRKAQEDIQKERDARLDAEVIRKSRDTFTNLAFDHTVVAPALRRIEAASPELAKAVDETLRAADEQLRTAGLFAEVGKSTTESGDSTSRINALAKAAVEAGTVKTMEQAVTFVLESDPSLYAEYQNERA